MPPRSIVITGAATGIGAALARRFARAGDRVALLDVDAARAGERARELAQDGATALALECDVTSPESCRKDVAEVIARFGGIDVLVNNAGITQLGRVRDTQAAVIRRVLEVNLMGAVHCTQAALPSLLERRGQVVAISSVAGFAPLATRAGYAASKHALHGFFGSLRAEHARDGLTVTLVCPSFVRTEIGAHALSGSGGPASAEKRTGVRHAIEPEAAAEAIFRGVARRRRLVFVGRQARLSWWLSRLAPALYDRAMMRRTLDE